MMKKLLCLLLCTVMVLPVLLGCTPEQGDKGEKDKVLQVGYGRVDVTPTQAIPLAGLGSKYGDRLTDNVQDNLYVTCVAFSDQDGNTALIYHMDILNTYDSIYGWLPDISSATGVLLENIVLAATHNHSGPSINSTVTPYMNEYRFMFKQALIDSAKAALEDLTAAQMYITTTNPENMTFVRHYVRDDGTVHGEGGNSSEAHRYVGYTVEADNQMQLIKFVREGKKDVLLMNWQGHPRAHGEDKYAVQNDVDVIRKRLEADMDCYFAYFLGASGNMNNSTVIPEQQRTKTYKEHGNVLADEAIAAAKNFTQVETGNVKVITDFSLQSQKSGDTSDINMTVFSIGDVAFLSAGYEMFCESGMELKDYSPFKMTFIVTCSNGDHKYMPTLATYKYSSYETGTATRHVKGTAEKLVAKYKTMLDQLSAE